MVRWLTDSRSKKARHNEAQRTRVENVGILIASGLIAGEALTVDASLVTVDWMLRSGRLAASAPEATS